MNALPMTWAAAVMGFSGLMAQQLLLRELLIVFAGNELTIGVILAGWLATEATGSIWARRSRVAGSADAEGVHDRIGTAAVTRYLRVTLLFCASLFPAAYAVRLIKPLLGISVGTVAGLGTAAAASLVIMAPVSLTHGAMFTLGCAVSSRRTPADTTVGQQPPAAHIYILETSGTLLAGLLWTAALIRLSDPFQVTAGVVVLNAVVVLHLSRRLVAGRTLWRSVGWALIAAAVLTVATGATGILHRRSLDTLWRHQSILHYENTMHGNIVITENLGQHTFFTDGTPAFLVPVPDTSLVEPLVHIPMAVHPHPQRVLLIGGGAGGFLDAILKHPSVTEIDYLELDSRLLRLQHDLAAAVEERAMDDPRVGLHAADTRVWLQSQRPRYDIIFSRDHDPDNLRSSRSFSKEFFRLAADSLTEHGALVLGFPALVGHLNEPLQNLAAGVHHSLEQVFPSVRAFPGDAHSFLVASSDPAIADLDLEDFTERLRDRGLLDAVALPWHVEQRLHPRWHPWFEQFAAGGSRRVIRDFQPRALFLSVAHWSSLNAPATARVLNLAYALNPVLLMAAVMGALLIPAAALNRFSPDRRMRVIPAVVATGFTAMVVNLSLIFSFQILVGHLFGWLGLLTAAFIAGLGVGALRSSYLLRKGGGTSSYPLRLLIRTDVVILLFGTLLLVLLPIAAPRIASWVPPALLRVLFFPVILASGAVCGAQFPVACSVFARADDDSDRAGGGLVYGADLLGGCAGGILGGIVVLPLLGLAGAGLTIGVLKAITVVVLIHATRIITQEARP